MASLTCPSSQTRSVLQSAPSPERSEGVKTLRVFAFWALLAGFALLVAFTPLPLTPTVPTDRLIRLEARSFEYTPSLLAVNPGDRVTLEIVATDYVHGLHLEGYDLNALAAPGQTARLTFVADQPGLFRFRCSVPCGALHPFMLGKLEVGPNWLLWRAVGLAAAAVVAAWRLVSRPARF